MGGGIPGGGFGVTDGGVLPGTTTNKPLGTTMATFGYVEYLPAGYTPSGSYPLIIFLHGSGEQGDGSIAGLTLLRGQGPNRLIDANQLNLPAVLISPQMNNGSWGEDAGNSTRLDAFLNYLLATYAVDSHKVYLTGLSLGGGGTWAYAARHPGRLTAIVPVCGFNGDQSLAYAQAMVGVNLPIWAAHAMNDTTVDPGNTLNWLGYIGQTYGLMVSVLGRLPGAPGPFNITSTTTYVIDTSTHDWRTVAGQIDHDAAGPFIPRQFGTFYPDGGHTIWDRMYSDPQVWNWMLQFTR